MGEYVCSDHTAHTCRLISPYTCTTHHNQSQSRTLPIAFKSGQNSEVLASLSEDGLRSLFLEPSISICCCASSEVTRHTLI